MYKSRNKHLISKRTGKNTVAIVGFAETTRHLVPYGDPDTEIWGINDAYAVQDFMQRWDRWFQLHPLEYLVTEDALPRDRNHMLWLKEEHEFPIYMQKHFDNMPASVEYPLNEVVKTIGRRYLTSSFSYLFGLALLEGFERIEIYGFEMATFSEYANQRPNAEYLIGKAEGRGIEVYIPPLSSICTGPIYGYEDLDITFRQEMEYLHMGIKEKIRVQTNEFHQLNGRAEQLADLVKQYPELKEALKTANNVMEEKVAQLNNTMGREQQAQEFIALYDSLKTKELANGTAK